MWREKLRDGLKHWRSVLMLTLTVDPKRYENAESAFIEIRQKRRVAELIRKLNRDGVLKTREFTKTIEFHKNGWPHYHLLVEASFVSKYKLQAAWKIGHCWVSKNDFESMDHAINYATKYIVKTDEDDGFAFPDWVLDFKGKVFRFSTSRGLCNTRKQPKRKKKSTGDKQYHQPTRNKLSKCGKTTKILTAFTRFSTTPADEQESATPLRLYRLEGVLRMPWTEAKHYDPKELERLLRVQQWNDKQRLTDDASVLEDVIARPWRSKRKGVTRRLTLAPTNDQKSKRSPIQRRTLCHLSRTHRTRIHRERTYPLFDENRSLTKCTPAKLCYRVDRKSDVEFQSRARRDSSMEVQGKSEAEHQDPGSDKHVEAFHSGQQ